MFLSHFHLNSDPFALEPNTKFFYPGPDHREALAALYHVITQRGGCGMMLGETGMGKTLVLRHLRELIGAVADTLLVTGPMDSAGLLQSLCSGFGISPEITGRRRRMRALEGLFVARMREGRHTVLAVDDADQLSLDALELLQVVCGFATAGGKTVDVLLAGRPALKGALAAPPLGQLRQSIEASRLIAPLDEEHTAQYLDHRLMIAGARQELFTGEASRLLAATTRGVPERINQLAHQSLARAWSRGVDRVTEDLVRQVTDELPGADLPGLAETDRWVGPADFSWMDRRAEDRISVGVSPCPNADDDGAFVASLGLLLRSALSTETLLIDLDTERPALGRNLRTPRGPGWSEMLESEPAIRPDCVHESPWRGVHVMPAGAAAVAYRPDEFERRLRWLHGTVTRHFRAVVTRFPQASACRELRGCFRIPDVVVLTLRPGACRASDVRREANALRAAGANLAGVILTKAEQQPQAI